MTTEPREVRHHIYRRVVRDLLTGLQRPANVLQAVEVGVYKGELSVYLLTSLPQLRLYMVDAWAEIPEGHPYRRTGDRLAKSTQEEWDAIRREADCKTSFAVSRRRTLSLDSVEAAELLNDASMDLVFIDAAHDYESVKADIAAWWPKVRPSGILCGHDYGKRRLPGVTQAVNEFAARTGLAIEAPGGRMWIVRKPATTVD